ncbi:MAG: ArsR/SmtB family transcription factor [Nocardioidaceae bacterium]
METNGRQGSADAYGDADVTRVATLFGEPSRARVLMALADGRALPASVLAAEAGLSPSATSAQLGRLLEAGLLSVEVSGRHRYYRLAGPDVAAVLEAMARLAPARPVSSLRQGTRANALRRARTCYDHLAGQLGVAITTGLLERDALCTGDGGSTPVRRPGDRLSAPLRSHPYRLGEHAADVFGRLGVDLEEVAAPTRGRSRRPLLRFCLDWTEQHHHLAGRLGAALLVALLEQGWVERLPQQRAIRVTDRGAVALQRDLGVSVPA